MLDDYAGSGRRRWLGRFLGRLKWLWTKILPRRSQRDRFAWKRIERMTGLLWPKAAVLHLPSVVGPKVRRLAHKPRAVYIAGHAPNLCGEGHRVTGGPTATAGRSAETPPPTRQREREELCAGVQEPCCARSAAPRIPIPNALFTEWLHE